MTSPRDTFFDRWASAELGIAVDALTLAEIERLPTPADLPNGPTSEMGGETQSVLDSPTESELRQLASLGEQLLSEFPPLPEGYRARAAPSPKPSGRS